MIEINFLSKQNQTLSAQQQKDKRLSRWSLIAFVIVMVCFTFVFAINLYLGYRVKKVEAQADAAKKQIDSEHELEASYLFFVNKLVIIRELFDQRADKQVAMNYFSELFGPEVTISGLNFNMEKGILSLQLTSPHVFVLENALATLDRPEVREQFVSLAKSNLTRRDDGRYNFTLTLSLNDESQAISVEEEY
ncbi:MAG TPA: hypothetical protein PLM16_01520 [Candidatus Woesebacteria bacterium]|nr:hypothetical protein [Candidatus Woesebacteria bacterium]